MRGVDVVRLWFCTRQMQAETDQLAWLPLLLWDGLALWGRSLFYIKEQKFTCESISVWGYKKICSCL